MCLRELFCFYNKLMKNSLPTVSSVFRSSCTSRKLPTELVFSQFVLVELLPLRKYWKVPSRLVNSYCTELPSTKPGSLSTSPHNPLPDMLTPGTQRLPARPFSVSPWPKHQLLSPFPGVLGGGGPPSSPDGAFATFEFVP